MREPAGGQAGGRHWQDCLGGGTLESGKEGGRLKKKRQSLDPHLLWPVRERCVSLPTQAASSLRIIDAEKQKQKTSKQTKPQSKQNHKCVCGAPVMCFCPILIIGDNGPVFPGEPSPWPGRFPLQSLTAAASNFLDLFSPPRSPPLSRPGLLITEEVKPLWGPLGFSVVPLPHLVSPSSLLSPWKLASFLSAQHQLFPCSGSQPPCCPVDFIHRTFPLSPTSSTSSLLFPLSSYLRKKKFPFPCILL